MAAGGLLDVLDHPNRGAYPGQRILIVDIDGYAFVVPFVADGDALFLKTIIPSPYPSEFGLARFALSA
jgi:hypothetical protein